MKVTVQGYPRKKLLQDLFFIVIVGLTPLLWFKSGHIINGPDVSFPLNPVTFFLNRLFTWNHLNNTGLEGAVNISTIFFHGLQAFFYWLSHSLFLTQKIIYCFWFTLVCFSIYYFGAVIQKDKPDRVARYVLVLIYAFNPLVFNIWEVAKAAEISSLVAMPLLLAFFMQGLDGRWSFLKASLIAGFSSLVFSEIGASPSVFAIPVGICFLFFFFYLFVEMRRKFSLRRLRNLFAFLVLFFTVYTLFNAYWILPHFFEIINKLKASSAGGALEAFNMVNWLKDISLHTSILNVSRFQGAWDWYYSWYDEPYVFYASSYFKYPFLLMASVILPILAYLAIVFKRSREVLFFILLALLATFFAKGAHSPFENIFLWCSKSIPGFAAFRSPYYKFSLATIFAYAYLISISLSNIYYRSCASRYFKKMTIRLRNLKEIKVLPGLILLSLLFVHLAYSYPMFTGKIIPIRKKLFSLHLKVPDYVFESADWLKAQKQEFRVFALPREYMDTYRWGYGAPTSLLNLAANTAVVWGRSVTFCGDNKVRDLFYEDLYGQISPNSHKLLHLLSVKYIWLRHDSWCDLYGDKVLPQDLKEKIRKLKDVSFAKSIGKWEFYEVKGPSGLVNVTKEGCLVLGSTKALLALANRYNFNKTLFVFDEQNEKENIYNLLEKGVIKKVIFYNYPLPLMKERIERDFKRELNFSFLYSSDELSFKPREGYRLPETIKLKKIIGLGEPERLDDDKEWLWLWTNKEPNIFISNSGGKQERVNLIFDVFSYKSDRDLYVYLNDELLKYFSLKADEVTTIRLKSLKLLPGENVISFYTPHMHDKRNKRFVSFAFRDFYLGALTFESKFFVPAQGYYDICLFPSSVSAPEEAGLDFKRGKEFIIDSEKINLQYLEEEGAGRHSVFLDKGLHAFELEQSSTEDYYIEIYQVQEEESVGDRDLYLNGSNPTNYRVVLEDGPPQFLVFNESYNPYWRLYAGNKLIENHLMVNGYANGWYLEQMNKVNLSIRYYWPQRLFYLGILISIISMFFTSTLYLKRWKK